MHATSGMVVRFDCWQSGKAVTFALAHDEAMMGHIKDALPFSLFLYRGTAALNALPDLVPTMTHFCSQWKPQHETLNSTRGKLFKLIFHNDNIFQPHWLLMASDFDPLTCGAKREFAISSQVI